MYATRPKSSKGRTRPKVAQSQSLAESLHHSPTFSPHPPPPFKTTERFDAIVRPRTVLRRSSKPSVLTEIYERTPEAPVPVPSLNKYRVLPSIDKKKDETCLEKNVSALSLSHDSGIAERRFHNVPGSSFGEMRNFSASHPVRAKTGHSEEEEEERLLLAVRTPSGRRLEWRFRPSDTLKAVISAAEAASGRRYENAVLETMEVPRRTFVELSATLSQCGILNKSVLCVSLQDDATDSN